MDRKVVVAAAAGVLLTTGLAWWALVPAKLGLAVSRVVLAAGDVELDGKRVVAKDTLLPGASLHAGNMSNGCFSVHASRVCLGGMTEGRLVDVGEKISHLDLRQGTMLLSASGDELVVNLPAPASGTLDIPAGLVAIEGVGNAGQVHVLEGSATLTAGGRPAAQLAQGACVGLADGKARPTTPSVEAEERGVLALAGEWQGSAGALIDVPGRHVRVDLDEHDVGRSPLTALLIEGHKTVVLHDGPKDAKMKSFDLKGAQKGSFGEDP